MKIRVELGGLTHATVECNLVPPLFMYWRMPVPDSRIVKFQLRGDWQEYLRITGDTVYYDPIEMQTGLK